MLLQNLIKVGFVRKNHNEYEMTDPLLKIYLSDESLLSKLR